MFGQRFRMIALIAVAIGASPSATAAAPAPSIDPDGDASPMVDIPLTGMAVGSKVAFGPDTLDMGAVGVGATASLASALAVTNRDPSHDLLIQSIEVSDPSFQISVANAFELPVGETRSFEVSFSPQTAGELEATAALYLDGESKAQATIKLRGLAITTRIHGSGCSASGGPGGDMVLAALAVLTVLAMRRCRRATALGAALMLVPVSAAADDVQVGVFHPTPATAGAGFQLDAADVGRHGEWIASSVLSYATNPLAIDISVEGERIGTAAPVARSSMLEVGGALAFFGRFEAGLRMPLYRQRGTASGDPLLEIEKAHGFALGDLTLHAKVRFLRMAWMSMGAASHVTIPTATQDQFTGTDLPTGRAIALATFRPIERWTLSLNGGGVLRKMATYDRGVLIEQGSGVTWGAGSSVRVLPGLAVTAEVFGEWWKVRHRVARSRAPVEALVGANYRVERWMTVGFAVGRGLVSGVGAPELRGTVVVSFAPGVREPAPPRPVVVPEVKVKVTVTDTDHDGIADEQDRCPEEPEDMDGFEDSDGCPDPDNDQDGVLDAEDWCSLRPETINGKDDDDGCPDDVADATPHVEIEPGQSPDEVAKSMFARGRELMKAKKFLAACAAFEQSQRLDPQTGTQYNLAGCYVEIGKQATAWNLYRELTRTDKKVERRANASLLADQLAPRVPKLKLVLVGQPAGLDVFMNGTHVNALVGLEVPVDRGTYRIVAGAPHHRGWRKVVEVSQEGQVLTIEIDLGPPLGGSDAGR